MDQLFSFSTLEVLLLVTALSVDAFVASFAYGTNKIKIPFKSVAVISLVCSGILGFSLFLGNLVKPFLPSFLTTAICFIILFVLGVLRFSEASLKTWLDKSESSSQAISFKFLDFNFLLRVYVDSTEADKDHSNVLTPGEAFSLAIALSVDGLAAGFSAGLSDINYLQVIIFSLIINMLVVLFGFFVGNKIAQKSELNLSWLSGVVLIVLAFMKIL